MESIYLAIPLASLIGAIIAGLFGGIIGRKGAHAITILGVGISCFLSFVVLKHVGFDGHTFYGDVYTWAQVGNTKFAVGFQIDRLTSMMMVVVTFVSLMVHIYTIGYMQDDKHNWPEDSRGGTNSYQRFFAYISLFTFSMLMLVMSNNFMQLFFGWEAVGLVSYLLIGFWSTRETAIFANMKAFLVNRVGDFGFLLGIAAIWTYTGSVDYKEVFERLPAIEHITLTILPNTEWMLVSIIAICLFIGAMGKSAQVPLHVWLPDSMEGPTPISALIHAATMVTAGIFMVARMSPIFEMSDTALSMVLIIGATTAFFMGLIGIVQNDIKRVVAYSTLSQLGYMTVALGASAYSAAVFHLMTHAFFKALLFLAAGSVIIAMHHEQDIRKMGGLKKYLPITYWTSLVGSLALIGFPFFSGFFSKDLIIEAVHAANIPGSEYAYWMVLLGVFVTAFYSFRMFFLVFHGEERMDEHTKSHLHEPAKVVTWPLIALAIPAVLTGYFLDPMVVGDFFDGVIHVDESHPAVETITHHFHGSETWIVNIFSFVGHGLIALPFWLAMAGAGSAYYIYMKQPSIAKWGYDKLRFIYVILDKKYFADEFNMAVFAGGAIALGKTLWSVGDRFLIDGLVVNGSAKVTGWFSSIIRHMQTGYLYHYAFSIIIGVLAIMSWLLFGANNV
ncbi:NADH-quinone oxidoreductase subunit L [Cocleimonas sp. KMM 6892]|uniref:NADH-quinone oxidoreductase subunit L n=1 Tax=unclassified Cocleimonas TaxID=2639732 RepID=UPI002DB8F381|nr:MULTISPECIES: NADH-quinone oxidoreductase subunit L [unclassified Cocleimonas]MEB8430658.1 NADH-quinone oxidoreductase subunit L [Cocleimonas sp. KMM 6892]MEC4716891.1 NADH-quinone oxidoreductase subunit L [Cocleimonas sp. KMM 6895]MEC4743903.1 NADH-quinone oxidoreductase subunit L [Cocleimonas sp. KMM 6896]